MREPSELYKLNKSDFTAYMNNRINARNEILEFVENIFKPTLSQFDGKVFNIRFIKALEEKNKSKNIFVTKDNIGFYYLTIFYELNGKDLEMLTIYVGKRIDYNSVVKSLTERIKTYNEETETYKECIENFDLYETKLKKLTEVVEEYNNLPMTFRDNVFSRFIVIW